MNKIKLLAFASMLMLLTTFNVCHGEMAKLTAFNQHEKDSRPYGAMNCQGTRLRVGQCAADLRYHKLGDKIHIQGMGTFIVADCGSGIKGRNRFDIYVDSLKKVNSFGVKYREVTESDKIVSKHSYKKRSSYVCYSSKRHEELRYENIRFSAVVMD